MGVLPAGGSPGLSPSRIRRTLDFPSSLDETYERILKEIKKPSRVHAHRLLQCLSVAIRPLLVEELAELLAFDFDAVEGGILKMNPKWRRGDHEQVVLSICSSLMAVVDHGGFRVVQLSHFSVKEFLTSNRLSTSSRDISHHQIALELAQTLLAQAGAGSHCTDYQSAHSQAVAPLSTCDYYWNTAGTRMQEIKETNAVAPGSIRRERRGRTPVTRLWGEYSC